MKSVWAAGMFMTLALAGNARAAEMAKAEAVRFADKRFYEVLEPYSKVSWRTVLRPDKITEDNQVGDIYEWRMKRDNDRDCGTKRWLVDETNELFSQFEIIY